MKSSTSRTICQSSLQLHIHQMCGPYLTGLLPVKRDALPMRIQIRFAPFLHADARAHDRALNFVNNLPHIQRSSLEKLYRS